MDGCWIPEGKIIHELRDVLHDVVQDEKLRCIRRDQVSKHVESSFFTIFVECMLASCLAMLILLEEETGHRNNTARESPNVETRVEQVMSKSAVPTWKRWVQFPTRLDMYVFSF